MSATHSVQIPPDSTGKKIRHERLTDVVITNEVNRPVVGDTIIGKTSGATGVFKADIRAGSIIYYIHLTVGAFTAGEVLWDGSATDYATVDETSGEIYTPAVHVTDPDQPQYIQKVDKHGAAFATFPEGTPQFDAYRRMQVSQMISIGHYAFYGEDDPEKYWTQEVGTGSVFHEPQKSAMVLQTGTASGDVASRTTNRYHIFKPATSQLIYISCTLGDSGKANLQRSWGYFDDLNGVGFREENGVMKVFLRSDTSGTPVDIEIPQDQWNGETLANPLSSPMVLDPTKANIYWIDIQWGAGRVRYGVVLPDGSRQVVNSIENINKNTGVYMRTPTLPLRWEQKNLGGVASTSEMRFSYGTVFNESNHQTFEGVNIHTSPVDPIKFTDSENYVPFLSFRPKTTINGVPNRTIGFHETFDWASVGNAPLHVGIFVKPPGFLTDAVWRSDYVPATMLETDIAGTTVIPKGTVPVESFIIAPNSNDRIHLGDKIDKSFNLPADGVTQAEFIFAARVLKEPDDVGTPSASLFYTKYWKEVR